LNPLLSEAHNNLGLALLLTGQHGQESMAEQEFKTAISINTGFADAENNLGTLYGQRGNDAEAERLFRQAIKSDPAFTKALVNLGATLASESRFAEADAMLRQALQIEPGNKEAQNLRAMIEAQVSH
jgi:Tfp pilus assembly protein PilF